MSRIGDDDIRSRQSVGRRGFVVSIGLGFVGATSLVTGSKQARAAQEPPPPPDAGAAEGKAGQDEKSHSSGCTDSDGGSSADPVGRGDRCAPRCDTDVGCFADRC